MNGEIFFLKYDFLTAVAPSAVTVTASPFGATVNGEYVFASQKPETITEGTAVFSGSYSYAHANQPARFQSARNSLKSNRYRAVPALTELKK